MPMQGLSKYPKELSGPCSWCQGPCKRKTSRKWEETRGLTPAPAPRARLPVSRMNIAFVPSAASEGF